MTDTDLAAAILADPTAKALVDAGNDSGAATRMGAILPPTTVSKLVDERALYAAFANPADALQVMTALATVASGSLPNSPIVARVLTWMSPAQGGVDISNSAVLATLAQLVTAGLITSAQSSTIQALAMTMTVIPVDQVSRCLATYRSGGH